MERGREMRGGGKRKIIKTNGRRKRINENWKENAGDDKKEEYESGREIIRNERREGERIGEWKRKTPR